MITKPESNSSFARTALLVVGALAIFCLGGLAAELLLSYRPGTATAEYNKTPQPPNRRFPPASR